MILEACHISILNHCYLLSQIHHDIPFETFDEFEPPLITFSVEFVDSNKFLNHLSVLYNDSSDKAKYLLCCCDTQKEEMTLS